MKNHFSFSIIREMKCILILLLLICGFASEILALRCITTDGLQVDEVRRVIKKCMKKITSAANDDEDDDLKNYDEYENYENVDYGMKDNGSVGGRDTNNDRMKNRNNNYNPHFNQYDERSAQTGGNYHEINRPRNDRPDPWLQQQQHQPFNPYQQQSPYNSMYDGGNNNYFANNQRGHSYGNNYQNKNTNDNSTNDKHERDRSCILQCFFQELKMVN